jgi:hypothetical protein
MGLTYKNLGILFFGVGLMAAWINSGRADGDAAFPMPPASSTSTSAVAAIRLMPLDCCRRVPGKRCLSELENHFGEDASLDESQLVEIDKAMMPLAADTQAATMLMRRIASGIAPGQAPQRISGSPYFKFMHDEVPASFWKRPKIGSPANCVCLPYARQRRPLLRARSQHSEMNPTAWASNGRAQPNRVVQRPARVGRRLACSRRPRRTARSGDSLSGERAAAL